MILIFHNIRFCLTVNAEKNYRTYIMYVQDDPKGSKSMKIKYLQSIGNSSSSKYTKRYEIFYSKYRCYKIVNAITFSISIFFPLIAKSNSISTPK